MSKCINKPIKVIAKQSIPNQFVFRQVYKITQLHDFWREAGQWWLGEDELYVYRAITERNSLVELHFNPKYQRWVLYKMQD